MAHAEICPVCGGRGRVTINVNLTAPLEQLCHGCGGKGWIEVQDEQPYWVGTKPDYVTGTPWWKDNFTVTTDTMKAMFPDMIYV